MRRVVLCLVMLLSLSLPAAAADRYNGEMTITVDYYDFCQGFGELRYLGRRSYRYAIGVTVGEPSTDGTLRESNPFHLFVQPRGNPMAEAGLSFMSAAVANTYRGPVLLQFWQIHASGKSFSGRLVRNGTQEGVGASNMFPSRELLVACRQEMGVWQQPHSLAPGTTLQGKFVRNSISITVTGQTTDTTRRFVASISASK